MVYVVHCERAFLVMTGLVLLCFFSIGIEARIMRNDDKNRGVIAVDSTTTPLMTSRMTTSTVNGGTRMMIATDDHNNDQLDQEYSAATETTEASDRELVTMDYSPARKKPPIHN